MNFFDSPPMRRAMSKIFLGAIFYIVAAASFNGFFLGYAFLDKVDQRRAFVQMYDETAHRPFIYRQFMIQLSKEIRAAMPKKMQKFLIEKFKEYDAIPAHYALSKIELRYSIEYHILYFMCFYFIFFSMFLWREIGIEITGNKTAGTLAACCFAVIFPLLEVRGVFYDCAELLFFSAATLFALKGKWLALILIAPIAEYNKESFLFFLITLFPFLAVKFNLKKAAFITLTAVFLSGCVYLYLKMLYAGNLGGNVEFHFLEHLDYMSQTDNWFFSRFVYGVYWAGGVTFLNILLVGWIIKRTWKKLSATWKNHFKIAAAINIPLYMIFCYPNEIRNLSLLYISFIAMLSIFIKDLITAKGEDDFGTEG